MDSMVKIKGINSLFRMSITEGEGHGRFKQKLEYELIFDRVLLNKGVFLSGKEIAILK